MTPFKATSYLRDGPLQKKKVIKKKKKERKKKEKEKRKIKANLCVYVQVTYKELIKMWCDKSSIRQLLLRVLGPSPNPACRGADLLPREDHKLIPKR